MTTKSKKSKKRTQPTLQPRFIPDVCLGAVPECSPLAIVDADGIIWLLYSSGLCVKANIRK